MQNFRTVTSYQTLKFRDSLQKLIRRLFCLLLFSNTKERAARKRNSTQIRIDENIVNNSNEVLIASIWPESTLN